MVSKQASKEQDVVKYKEESSLCKKKENKKKTEAKNKLKGTIVIDALPMSDPDFRGKDNVPDTPMHDNFGGEPPKFDVNEPRIAVDYMKPEHRIPPKSKPAKSQPPLKELNKLVENIKPLS